MTISKQLSSSSQCIIIVNAKMQINSAQLQSDNSELYQSVEKNCVFSCAFCEFPGYLVLLGVCWWNFCKVLASVVQHVYLSINTWGICRSCSAHLALQNCIQHSLHTVRRAIDSSLYLNLTPWSHYKCIHLRFSYQGRVQVCWSILMLPWSLSRMSVNWLLRHIL